MYDLIEHGSVGKGVHRFKLVSTLTGQGLEGLTSASSGLIISTICDVEAAATAYTVAGSTVETITTLGTWAAPTATKCRFKEVDATNHKGIYEFQFANARYAVTNATRMIISVSGATNLLQQDYLVLLTEAFDSDQLVDDVLDEDLAGHLTQGTAGEAIHRISNREGRLRSR